VAKLRSAIVTGMAGAGMHYAGMAVAQFAPHGTCLGAGSGSGLSDDTLAIGTGIITLTMVIVTLVIASLDTHFAAHTSRLAQSRQVANEQLRNIAFYDDLTGLPTRLMLEDRMQQALAHAERNKKSFALLFVDLDKFKPVNESVGHVDGDELLKSVAQRLNKCLRKEAAVARIGGDEFLIVFCGVLGKTATAAAIGRRGSARAFVSFPNRR
jgi:GGDEF domain-containing protein